MKTIIAATNYTDLAENAVAYAAGVAQKSNYKLILLNDFAIPLHSMHSRMSAEQLQILIDENKLLLEAKALLLAAQYGIEVSAKATFSFIKDALQELIAEQKVELIVMGMEEKSLEQDLLGNATTSVIKKLRAPIIAVPSKVKFVVPKVVLFACDAMHGISGDVLALIKDMALITRAEIAVLLINETVEALLAKETGPQALRRIDEGLEGIDYYYKNIKSDSIIRGIADEIKKVNADMLIMAPQQYGFWSSMVHRSKTRIMASGLNIPLFSIPV